MKQRTSQNRIQSASMREASEICFHGCCPTPFLTLPHPHDPHPNSTTSATATSFQSDFATATASSLQPNIHFTNHESLPSMVDSFSDFRKSYPLYSSTIQADEIRAQEYSHLSLSNHVCLDYIGHGLFSYSQWKRHHSNVEIASASSSNLNASGVPFFDIAHKSVNLNSQILQGGKESELETVLKKRIMRFMNVSEEDYSMVFTANETSSLKLVAESYPFNSNPNLLTTYDHESNAVEELTSISKKKGARVMSAEFSWPTLRIHREKLRKILVSKKKKKEMGLFVFPLQSRMTGAQYSLQWMSIAKENGWHVLLDASSLGAKDMETLGLSLFQPDFLICSLFKVFGDNPSGFACLFVKKTSALMLDNSSDTSIGIISIVPASRSYQQRTGSNEQLEKDNSELPSSSSGQLSENPYVEQEIKQSQMKPREESSSEIVEFDGLQIRETSHVVSASEAQALLPRLTDKTLDTAQSQNNATSTSERLEIQFMCLDHADSLGLILISNRTRFLVNWLVNALLSLKHPSSENGFHLVRIYGPKVRYDRGPAIAFNIFDWKGSKIDPKLVQKIADRNKISLSYGVLKKMWFLDQYQEEQERVLEGSTIEDEAMEKKKKNKREINEGGDVSVVTAALGFLTNFGDMYRVWVFVSRFLDADFMEKEKWRYMALNRKTVEV